MVCYSSLCSQELFFQKFFTTPGFVPVITSVILCDTEMRKASKSWTGFDRIHSFSVLFRPTGQSENTCSIAS